MNIFKKNTSTSMSLPKSKTVHGIEVKKVPIGIYLTALRELEELPEQIISELFPGKTISDVIADLVTLTADKMVKLLIRALIIAPEYIIGALAVILGVDKALIAKLTPNEIWDVGEAYWKMNDMTDFFARVSGLIKNKLPTLTQAIGSSGGSPLPRASELPKKAS